MLSSPLRRLLVVSLLCLCPAARGADDLPSGIEKVVKGPDYAQAHWGVCVVDAETGKTLYELNAEQLFAPASVTKLYSCATALCTLGPDHRFKTPVYSHGKVENGVLKGDLILVASGDLTLGGRTGKDGKAAFRNSDHTYANGNLTAELTDTDPLAGLDELARQVHKSGIRKVTGEVLVDDRLFAHARGSGSGPDNVTPILVNDNVLDIVITPGENAGGPATVRVRPETMAYQVDARVQTVEKGEPLRTVIRGAGSGRITVRGEIPVDRRPVVRNYPVEDPALFARALFIECLRRRGIDVTASPLAAPSVALPEKGGCADLAQVAEFTSPPLSEAIKVTLKVSHNLYASTLPLLVAGKHGKETLADGMRQQGKFLRDLGVDVKTISFGGGAGGAAADMTTPKATVQLLQAMRKRAEWPAYRDALPVLGVDGTLWDVVGASSPAKGQVWAKTGTLSWTDFQNDRTLLRSKALAGVVRTEKGKELVFAMFVNNVPLPKGVETSREGKVLGRLCEILAKHAD